MVSILDKKKIIFFFPLYPSSQRIFVSFKKPFTRAVSHVTGSDGLAIKSYVVLWWRRCLRFIILVKKLSFPGGVWNPTFPLSWGGTSGSMCCREGQYLHLSQGRCWVFYRVACVWFGKGYAPLHIPSFQFIYLQCQFGLLPLPSKSFSPFHYQHSIRTGFFRACCWSKPSSFFQEGTWV